MNWMGGAKQDRFTIILSCRARMKKYLHDKKYKQNINNRHVSQEEKRFKRWAWEEKDKVAKPSTVPNETMSTVFHNDYTLKSHDYRTFGLYSMIVANPIGNKQFLPPNLHLHHLPHPTHRMKVAHAILSFYLPLLAALRPLLPN